MLNISMEHRGSISLYEYVYQQIRDQIVQGEIGVDEHLPSKRTLAEHLGISVITIEKAYSQLVAEGYVYSLPRRGFYASELPHAASLAGVGGGERDEAAVPVASQPVADGRDDGDLSADLSPAAQEGARLWQRALRATLAQESEAEVFSPAPAQGTERLRRAIAGHLRGSRGIEVDPANIVVGAGAQLLDTMLVQLLGADSVYAVEDPGYLRLTRIYQAMGCEVRHIPLDGEGVRIDDLADQQVDILHLMPSHQYPTGRVTSIARRYALLSWASCKDDRYLIEDDFDCEFRLAGKPIPPLAAIDAGGRVIYTNTFSKSLSSALRLAYMVLPSALMERFRSELGFYSSTVSSIDQVTLARLLESGEYERHVRRVRKRAREVRDAMIVALDESGLGDGAVLEGADAGLHAVLAIRTDADPREVLACVSSGRGGVSLLSDCAWDSRHAETTDGYVRLVVPYLGLSVDGAHRLIGRLKVFC